jgi:hypothetical protein
MPTSSLTKNFVIDTEEMAQKFVNAIEMSQKDRRESVKSIKIRYFSDMTDKEKKEFLSKLQRLGT